ncbi:MAG: hypothetical protein P8Z76_04800 [Alphaproteobacteria bacterium]
MADDRDELGKTVKRIAATINRRGHATWFHTDNEFQDAGEKYSVAQWANVMNERHGWNIRAIRKNPRDYPDCLADFGPDGAHRPEIMGVEVTELVDKAAIGAHQMERRLAEADELKNLSDAERRDLLWRKWPEWPVDKFKERLAERVCDKDTRSRDRSLKKQFLLVVTDEWLLDERTVGQYLDEVTQPHPRTYDADNLMLSYMPSHGNDGYYPVFEVPLDP